MALSSTDNRKLYQGDGLTTAFAFPYAYQSQTDLVVKTRTGTGLGTSEVDKTLTSHYTIAPTIDATAGGTVTMLTAPDATTTLVIYRNPPQTQTLDLQNDGDMPAESVEKAFDKVVMMIQRIQEQLTRAAVLRPTDSSISMALPLLGDRTGSLLGFDSSGSFTAFQLASITSAAVTPFAASLLDDLSATAMLTTLGLLPAATGRSVLEVYNHGPTLLSNAKVVASVTASSLVLSLQTQSGASPSATSPVIVSFRDTTLATSGYHPVTCTTQPTLTIDVSSTLGHSATYPGLVHAFLMDVSGTLELMAISGANVIGSENQVTTTVVGTTGLANSRYTPYSTAARTASVRYVQGFESSQTTAGIWAAAPQLALGDPHNQKRALRSTVVSSGNAGHGSASTKIRNYSVSTVVGRDWTVASDTTLGTVYNCIREGLYHLEAVDKDATASQIGFSIDATGSQLTSTIFSLVGTAPYLKAVETPAALNTGCNLTYRFSPGQKLRVHTAGAASMSNECSMRITKIGE